MARGMKRIPAVLLIISVLFGVTSCGKKISPQRYRDYALKEIDAIEYDSKDFGRLHRSQLEAGAVTYVTDVDDTVDAYGKRVETISPLMPVVKALNISGEDMTGYKIEDAAYVEIEDKAADDRIPYHSFSSVMYGFEDKKDALAAFEAFSKRIEETTGIDPEELEDTEYKLDSKSYKGFFVLVIGGKDLKDLMNRSLDLMYDGSEVPQELRDAVDDFCTDKYRLVGYTHLDGKTITVVLYETLDGRDKYFAGFNEYLGIGDDILDRKNSEMLYEGLVSPDFGSIIVNRA